MTQTDTKEFEELTINSVAGLQAFLANARAQYDFGLAKETELATKGVGDVNDDLQHAFQTLRHTTNKLISKVQNGDSISLSDANVLQADYDELVRAVLALKAKASKPNDVRSHETVKVENKPVQKQVIVTEKAQPTVTTTPKQHSVSKDTSLVSTKPTEQGHLKTNKKREEQQLAVPKPKTGTLSIASDDKEVIDVKKQITFDKSVTIKQIKKENERLVSAKKKLEHLLKQCQSSFELVVKKHPKPNTIQTLLLEEAREGIEHLELILKRLNASTPLSAVAEVASHVKYALDSVDEAGQINENKEGQNGVSVITTSANASKGKSKVSSSSAVSFVPTSITVKKPSVAKRTIPRELQTLPKPDDIYKQKSLTLTHLQLPKYQQHITDNYKSPAVFEQLLDATVTKIEANTIDSLERWLGDLPASAFAFLEDMTVEEVLQFANRRYDEVAADLRRENIKYETFVAWRDLLDEMLEVVTAGKQMKFGQLFAVWMAELDIDRRG